MGNSKKRPVNHRHWLLQWGTKENGSRRNPCCKFSSWWIGSCPPLSPHQRLSNLDHWAPLPCELFWNRKRLRVNPEMHYVTSALTSAQLTCYMYILLLQRSVNIFHPALTLDFSKCHYMFCTRFLRPLRRPSCLFCWNLFVHENFGENWHWANCRLLA